MFKSKIKDLFESKIQLDKAMGSREYNPWKALVDNRLGTTNGEWDPWGNIVGRATDYRYTTHPRSSNKDKRKYHGSPFEQVVCVSESRVCENARAQPS